MWRSITCPAELTWRMAQSSCAIHSGIWSDSDGGGRATRGGGGKASVRGGREPRVLCNRRSCRTLSIVGLGRSNSERGACNSDNSSLCWLRTFTGCRPEETKNNLVTTVVKQSVFKLTWLFFHYLLEIRPPFTSLCLSFQAQRLCKRLCNCSTN